MCNLLIGDSGDDSNISLLCIFVSLNVSVCVFVCVQAHCQEVRKKKDLELQILTEPIRNWEGDDIRTLGPVLHMSQAKIHTQHCQVLIRASKPFKLRPETILLYRTALYVVD